MSSFRPEGTFTAVVTPFSSDGASLDLPAYDAFLEAQIAAGVSGLVPAGTTGEAPTLSDREQAELVARAVQCSKGKNQVMAGVGSNATAKAAALARAAEEAGADAVMVVMPYYNKPNQSGLLQHVRTVSEATSLPVVLYNVPGRTVVGLNVETTLAILDACPNVVGVKDASNNVLYCQELLSRAGDRVSVLCGDDALTVALMAVGARGLISVTSNVLPRPVVEVVQAMLAGRHRDALGLHYRLLKVHAAMFCAPSPVPAKTALAARGKMKETVRLPLVAATASEREQVISAITEFEAA